jgi:hypothetical protein
MVLDSLAKMSNRPKRQGKVLSLGEIVKLLVEARE